MILVHQVIYIYIDIGYILSIMGIIIIILVNRNLARKVKKFDTIPESPGVFNLFERLIVKNEEFIEVEKKITRIEILYIFGILLLDNI